MLLDELLESGIYEPSTYFTKEQMQAVYDEHKDRLRKQWLKMKSPTSLTPDYIDEKKLHVAAHDAADRELRDLTYKKAREEYLKTKNNPAPTDNSKQLPTDIDMSWNSSSGWSGD